MQETIAVLFCQVQGASEVEWRDGAIKNGENEA